MLRLLSVVLVGLVASVGVTARVKVRAEFDKTFAFKSVRTWAWAAPDPGHVVMARSPRDDPDRARRAAEPIILESVATEMSKLKLQHAATDADLTVTYFLLLSTNMSAQEVGQFVPAVVSWGLPLFPPATQSLKYMNRGSLVLDLNSKTAVVWRGVADAELEADDTNQKREKVLRESIRDLLKRYPSR